MIDTGQPNAGERVLPDAVDTLTDMRWEVTVACYAGNIGTVYTDLNPGQNTVDLGDDLFGFGGVVLRGIVSSYYNYNSVLDAVEIVVSRQDLLDAGWNGLNAETLHYQIYSTRDGTQNDPRGLGDIGGRSDIRDSIYDDNVAEDHFFSQGGVPESLSSWIPGGSRCSRVQFSSIVHGNQAIQPERRFRSRTACCLPGGHCEPGLG